MSKNKVALFTSLIVVLLFINITLGLLIYKVLYGHSEEESIYLSSEKIVEDAAKFVLQHIDYFNIGNYDEAYNNFTEAFKESISLDDYVFAQTLRKELYSDYKFINYTFKYADDRYRDNKITYDKKMEFTFKLGCTSLILDQYFENEYTFNVLYKDNSFYLHDKRTNYNEELALYYASLAYVDFKAKDYDSSLANSIEGLRYNPNMLSIYFIKGQAEFMLSKYEDSIQSMNTALIDDLTIEDKSYAYTTLAASYAYLGDYIKGKEFIDKAMELSPNDEFSKIVRSQIEDNLSNSKDPHTTFTYSNDNE
ncbi:tetratricopeptide repeat protein [Wukongibacter sp. M2B1]|uniref:tetratricopeptide repeat protein n=1 Tax=Wukongibacter sp. M2B1 TaxID=3088895 RepID=UPI003D79D248